MASEEKEGVGGSFEYLLDFEIMTRMEEPTIVSEHIGKDGEKYNFEYFETDSFDHLPKERIKQCYAVAFLGDKILIVNNIKTKTYGLVGGSVEEGEDPSEALLREIKEESNMRVLDYKPIGYQRVVSIAGAHEPYYQLRYFCVVEPYGPFISDPAGFVTEVLMVDPENYKRYFDWGEIGDRIVKRALEIIKYS